jgi:hypothetical protein
MNKLAMNVQKLAKPVGYATLSKACDYDGIQYNTTYRTETCLSTSQRAVFGS